jgi:hypothetical protein
VLWKFKCARLVKGMYVYGEEEKNEKITTKHKDKERKD